MPYVPNVWKRGERITKEKLNHLEQGVVEASKSNEEVVIVHASAQWDESTQTYKHVTADKTASEVFALIDDDKNVIIKLSEEGQDVSRWLTLSRWSESSATFTSQDVHDDIESRYNVDVYTLEFTR